MLLSDLEKQLAEDMGLDMCEKIKDMMQPVIVYLNSIEDNFISVGGVPNFY